MKGKPKEQFRASEYIIHLRCLVEYGDYLYKLWSWPQRWLLLPLSSRLQTWVGKTGWSWTELWIRLSVGQYWLGMGSDRAVLGSSKTSLGLPESSTITCLHWGRMWITCWWLDLLHLTTWESAAVEHHSPGWGRLLVVLSEDHDLCC